MINTRLFSLMAMGETKIFFNVKKCQGEFFDIIIKSDLSG
jgi:hypothetical protein